MVIPVGLSLDVVVGQTAEVSKKKVHPPYNIS
jgi:hypothetical protein